MATQTLLTTAETAKRLHLSTRTITRRAADPRRDDHIPPVRKLDGVRGGYLFDARIIAQLAPEHSLTEGVA